MAIAKTRAWDDVYAKLGHRKEKRRYSELLRLMIKQQKTWPKSNRWKTKRGQYWLLRNQIRERLKGHFETLLNKENPRMVTGDGSPNQGMTTEVTRTEVEKALRKMKNGKSPGPDGDPSVGMEVLGERRDWQANWTNVEKNGERRGCLRTGGTVWLHTSTRRKETFRTVEITEVLSWCHTPWKSVKRSLMGWIQDETSMGAEQFGFMLGRSTMDAVFSLRVIMEKYREGQKRLHMVFIDLEKAYDWVPWQYVWRCMRENGVPEKFVKIIQDMYDRVQTHVQCSIGEMESSLSK